MLWDRRGAGLTYQPGNFLFGRVLPVKMMTTDLAKQATRVDVLLDFSHGRYDYTVSCPEASTSFKELRAPLKGFYTFEKSAHSPMFQEPVKMRQIPENDVLAGTNSLADEE